MQARCWAMLLLASLMTLAATPIKELAGNNHTWQEIDLKKFPWKSFEKRYQRVKEGFLLDNGDDPKKHSSVGKVIRLNQSAPVAIKVTAESKALGVNTNQAGNYALYLDILFMDGTTQWGVKAPFTPGSHDWEKREIIYKPQKPIKNVECWILLRRRGKALVRNLQFFTRPTVPNAQTFDAVQVINKRPYSGWMLRDVKNNSHYMPCQTPHQEMMGVSLDVQTQTTPLATFMTATIKAPDLHEDRCLNLTYVRQLEPEAWKWLSLSRQQPKDVNQSEFSVIQHYGLGATGSASTLPFAAVATAKQGVALGMDLLTPAYGRVFFNADTRELAVTWDIALTPEVTEATVKLVSFTFKPTWGIRSAFAKFYQIYPENFKVRLKKQGIWMAFFPIGKIEDYQDFGFAVKEGRNDAVWDDKHDIATFRYTEPMTWWMKMGKQDPRTSEHALKVARLQAKDPKIKQAKAFESSVFHDIHGKPYGQPLNTPWCNGVVWSMNSMPGIQGQHTDFNVKWGQQAREKAYGPKAWGNLEGEYVDSSEGYVTAVMDYNRAHFSAAKTPLTFDTNHLKPGIFRGLIAAEYVRALAQDLHPQGKMVMANGTPKQVWYLAPYLDVMGTEANWFYREKWRPSNDETMLYRRMLCAQKPFCFLQNTNFAKLTPEIVEKYMRRSLFYGMYPSFFSGSEAKVGHYFQTPEFYNRDRHLFKIYIPLCKLVGEAGWQPETNAWSMNRDLVVERFGTEYFTVFNLKDYKSSTLIDFRRPFAKVEALRGNVIPTGKDSEIFIELKPEDVAVLKVTFK